MAFWVQKRVLFYLKPFESYLAFSSTHLGWKCCLSSTVSSRGEHFTRLWAEPGAHCYCRNFYRHEKLETYEPKRSFWNANNIWKRMLRISGNSITKACFVSATILHISSILSSHCASYKGDQHCRWPHSYILVFDPIMTAHFEKPKDSVKGMPCCWTFFTGLRKEIKSSIACECADDKKIHLYKMFTPWWHAPKSTSCSPSENEKPTCQPSASPIWF